VTLGLENSAEEIDTLLQVVRSIAAQPHRAARGEVQQQISDFAAAVAQHVYAPACEVINAVAST
jgi:hypothetical protein